MMWRPTATASMPFASQYRRMRSTGDAVSTPPTSKIAARTWLTLLPEDFVELVRLHRRVVLVARVALAPVTLREVVRRDPRLERGFVLEAREDDVLSPV